MLQRIFVKTAVFRTIIFLLTILVVFIFTNDVSISGAIGVIDFLIKTLNYFLYDWIWTKIKWGINDEKNDTHLRTLVKTIVFRVEVSCITIVIVYLFTKEITKSLSIATVEFFVKMVAYYANERIWGKIQWGKPQKDMIPLEYTGLCTKETVDLP